MVLKHKNNISTSEEELNEKKLEAVIENKEEM